MKVTRPKNIHNWELQHKKQPNKKMKISLIRRKRSSIEEQEEEKENYDYFNKLSADVITYLFLRCPLKSLAMLRCTSKSWNDIIISPLFLHSHLRQSIENGPQILFMKTDNLKRPERSRLQFISVDMDGSKEELYTVTVPDEQLTSSTMQVCFGLVCLSTNCRIYLCNPAMQQLCELPKYSPSVTPGYNDCGFGYLHSRKEYKVVHFFYRGPSTNKRWCHLRDLQHAQVKCEVLTVNKVGGGISFNRWKEIADTPSCHPFMPGLLVNECMYWFTRRRGTVIPREIISFDFENEKFLTISQPSSYGSIYGLVLMDLKGMLCLPDAMRFHRSSILDLWILKDKVSCTWVKEYSINLVKFAKTTSYFRTWNEEIIFSHLDKVVIYDLKRKCSRVVKRAVYNYHGIYSKSLFSLGSV